MHRNVRSDSPFLFVVEKMELQKETRSRFFVKVEQPIKVDIDGVRADGDVIEFWKSGAALTFKSLEDCQKWFDQYKENNFDFVPMQRVSKSFEDVQTKVSILIVWRGC